MDGIMRGVHAFGRYQRMAYLKIASVYLMFLLPLNGMCLNSNEASESQKLVHDILVQVDAPNSDVLVEEFDKFEDLFDGSSDPLAEGRTFLDAFLREINAKYNSNLTIQDACKLVRENLHTLQMPEEAQKIILATIELYGSEVADKNLLKAQIYWPWEWNSLSI